MNNNKIIIDQLKQRNIPSEVREIIFPMLEKNIERIQFVKSFVGLKDILYLEELEVEFFDFPFFLSLNCKTFPPSGGTKHESLASVYENAITDIKEIARKLQFFFEETNNILFIESAFQENVLTNDDMWKVYYKMSEESEKEPFEIMTRMYRYPEWYNVEYGDNVAIFEESITLLKKIDNQQINEEIKSLEREINKALEENRLDELPSLVSKLKTLKNQIHSAS